MSDSASRVASVALADHEIHIFYEIAFRGLNAVSLGGGPAITLGDLWQAGADCLPSDQADALTKRYRRQRVWQPGEIDVGSDIYDHLRAIVGGARASLVSVWHPTALAERLLATGDLYEEGHPSGQRQAKRLDLTPGKRASARLEEQRIAPRSLTVDIESLHLHLFATGVGLVHAGLSLRPAAAGKPLTALELLEAQVAIARFGRLRWMPAQGAATGDAPAFSFGLLLRRLVLGALAQPSGAERPKTYSYLRLAGPLPAAEADLLALRFARHYTTDYAIAPDIGGVARIRAFETVTHALALEGVATIVAPTAASGELPAFLQNFREGTLRRHYLPIALLNFHEYCFLLERSSRAIVEPGAGRRAEKTLKTLGQLRSDSLFFRVNFRYAQVSHVTMHNELNRGLREALGLDRMMREFAADVAEIEAFLRAVEEHKSRRRLYAFSMIGGASLAALSALTIFREAASVLLDNAAVKGALDTLLWPFVRAGIFRAGATAEQIGLLAGIVVFLLSLFLLGQRRPLAFLEEDDDRTDRARHAMIEMGSGKQSRRPRPRGEPPPGF